MRAFSVVPQEPGNQLAVELVGSQQQLLMIVNEFFLEGSIEPFHVGIHLGSFGIGMPVVFVQASEFFIEVLHELRAIIGEHRLKRVGKHLGDDVEEFSSSQRSMTVGGPGKAKARVLIGKRDDISPQAIEEILHRIKGSALPGTAGFIPLGFSAP